MAVNDPDRLELKLGKTTERQNIWLWLYLHEYRGANFEEETCNGLTMRETLATFIESSNSPPVAEIKKAMDRFLAPDENLKWITGDERQAKWLSFRVIEMTQLPSLVNPPKLTNRSRIIGTIDLWDVSLSQKVEALSELSHDWEQHRSKDSHFKWFEDEKEEIERCRFAWEWLQKNKSISQPGPPRFESYRDLLMFFDSSNLRELERKSIAKSIRQRWGRQSYLEKLGDRKQYNFILSNKIIEMLDALADANDLKRPQALEMLIEAEAKLGTHLPKKLQLRK
ncbi:hypothetical protein SBP02_11510 [Pseudomonas benzenivorans]|uniref:Uncharacterized protein n=1 Tax=Pseudomonas benzenivorans TaxID=556533 RepID=A0ABZ0PQI2_9PSED|nr:hypothetical protein [Pseudomonas benzenivorans]WPC03413.1 hypothetical protein SBP02_11510 [Pseudomonas benzenivorans]